MFIKNKFCFIKSYNYNYFLLIFKLKQNTGSNIYINLYFYKINDSLLPFRLIAGSKFIEKFAVHFHEGFENVVNEGHDRLVPMLFTYSVQCREHDSHNYVIVFLDQWHNVLIIPQVKCSLSNLKKSEIINFISTKQFWTLPKFSFESF